MKLKIKKRYLIPLSILLILWSYLFWGPLFPWNTIKSNLSPIIHQAQEKIKKKWKKNPPKVLDPFSGGGSIPLEALRLGCETYASDLNPVAVIINKATLEWPQQIANPLLAQLVNKWAILNRLRWIISQRSVSVP